MKRVFTATLSLLLFALVLLPVLAATGSLSNDSNPVVFEIPGSVYGGNKIASRYSAELEDFGAETTLKYRWHQLSGNSDVKHACRSLKMNGTINMVATVIGNDIVQNQVTDVFYGDDMTTSSDYTLPTCSVTTSALTIGCSYHYSVKVRNPADPSNIICTNSYTRIINP